MSRLSKKLIYLLLPFLLLALYTEYNLRQVENGYSRKSSDIEQALDSTQVLILGSSHSLFGVDPDQFSQSTFNMAYVSQSLYYDRMILGIYLDRMPALKTVVLPISYFSLDTSIAMSTEKWRCYFYEKYFSLPVEGSSVQRFTTMFDLKRYSMIALYGIPKSLKHLRNNFRLNLVSEQQLNGWLKRDLSVPLQDKKGQQAVALHESLMFPGLRPVNMVYLQEMATLLRQRNIRLVLVTLPVHQTYSAHIDIDRYKSMVEASNKFCAENGCDYLNLFSDQRFGDADYFDTDHLNSTGARKFSKLLGAQISR